MSDDRRKRQFQYLKLSTITALVYQIVNVIYGLILPNLYLTHYGSEVNGLVFSIAQYLGLISFCEMGIGAVVQSALYKPLANGDSETVSLVMIEAKLFFKKIAFLLCIYVVFLLVLFPNVINNSFGVFTTSFLIIAISINTFSEYYFGLSNQILLNADQKQYINYLVQIGCTVITAVLSIILINGGVRIEFVKLITSLTLMIRPIFLMLFVRKKYNLDYSLKRNKTVLNQKKSGILHHLAFVIVDRIDIVVLSLFSSLTNVSIYYVYYMVVAGVRQIVVYATSGIEAFLGYSLAKESSAEVNHKFSYIEWTIHSVCTLIFGITCILILPFVNVYTRNISDANYLIPAFAFLMVAAQYMYCIRLPYYMMIKAEGAYTQTINSAAIEAIINVVVSVIMVKKYGLVGVAIGTFSAMTYRTLYFVIYLKNNILFRKLTKFIKQIIVDIIAITVIFCISQLFSLGELTYLNWILLAVKVSIIAIIVVVGVNIVAYRKFTVSVISVIVNRFKKKL